MIVETTNQNEPISNQVKGWFREGKTRLPREKLLSAEYTTDKVNPCKTQLRSPIHSRSRNSAYTTHRKSKIEIANGLLRFAVTPTVKFRWIVRNRVVSVIGFLRHNSVQF